MHVKFLCNHCVISLLQSNSNILVKQVYIRPNYNLNFMLYLDYLTLAICKVDLCMWRGLMPGLAIM